MEGEEALKEYLRKKAMDLLKKYGFIDKNGNIIDPNAPKKFD
jgi:hypothetical protein